MTKKDDGLARAKRIQHQLRELRSLKASQDLEVASLMSTVGLDELEQVEISDAVRASFEACSATLIGGERSVRAPYAIRG